MRVSHPDDPEHLRALAKRAKASIRHQQMSAFGHTFTGHLQLRPGGRRVRCLADASALCYEIEGLDSGVMFAIGGAVASMGVTTRLSLAFGPERLPVHVSPGYGDGPVEGWLSDPRVERVTADLQLRAGDLLFACRNVASLVVHPRSDDENWALLDLLGPVVDLLPAPSREDPEAEVVEGLELSPDRLPEQFRHLAPLIRKWSVGDDLARSEKEAAASTEELRELYDAFVPLFGDIDAYTRPFREGADPEPDEVIMLDRATEAAAEVYFDLKRRGAI